MLLDAQVSVRLGEVADADFSVTEAHNKQVVEDTEAQVSDCEASGDGVGFLGPLLVEATEIEVALVLAAGSNQEVARIVIEVADAGDAFGVPVLFLLLLLLGQFSAQAHPAFLFLFLLVFLVFANV